MSLVVERLSVHFGGVIAVNGVGFQIEPGEVFGLIGPNGAGKTTIIDAITGFLPGHGGNVSLDGHSINGLRASARARRGMTRSFQSLELFEDLTIADNLRVATDDGRHRHLLRDLLKPRQQSLPPVALAVIEEVGISDVLHLRPEELPYAQRRTAAIARAVASGPSVLLLDEPAAGLDPESRRDLERLVRRLADDWGMAILLIEHDVDLVMRACDRVMALQFGNEVVTGLPEDVRANREVVESYLGSASDVSAPESSTAVVIAP
jgi:sulfate-transporting ATPase